MKNIDKITNKAKNEATRIQEIADIIDGDNFDYDLIHDFLEGETDTLELIDEIIQEIDERNILITGLKKHISDAIERRSRLENGVEKMKAVICHILKTTNLPKITRPTYTLSLKDTPKKLLLEDDSLIPSNYYSVAEPKLDRKRLISDLKEGIEIPGAELSEKGFTIQIRNK